MKLQKIPVLAAAFLVAWFTPAIWAHGGGPGGGRGGGCHGGRGGGCHGGWGCRGPGGRFGALSFSSGGGGYCAPFWGMGCGGYAWGWPSGAACGSTCAAMPSYTINYNPVITTDVASLPAATAPVVAEQCPALAGGDLVGNVQRALRQRGFYKGPIDGVSGAATREAIRAYAASCGLMTTGVIDSALLQSLGLL